MSLKNVKSKLTEIVKSATNEKTIKKFEEFLVDTKVCTKDVLDIYAANPIFIQKEDLNILNKGTHQIIADIGEKLLIKTRLRYPDFDHYVISTSHYTEKMISSYKNLKKFGYEVAKTHFLGMKDNIVTDKSYKNCPIFLAVEDLTKNGKYEVVEYSPVAAKKAINAIDFPKTCAQAISFLTKLYHLEQNLKEINSAVSDYQRRTDFDSLNKEFSYIQASHRVIVNGHIKEERNDPLKAIEHMFFIQFNEYNFGTLIAGDLDHTFLLEN